MCVSGVCMGVKCWRERGCTSAASSRTRRDCRYHAHRADVPEVVDEEWQVLRIRDSVTY